MHCRKFLNIFHSVPFIVLLKWIKKTKITSKFRTLWNKSTSHYPADALAQSIMSSKSLILFLYLFRLFTICADLVFVLLVNISVCVSQLHVNTDIRRKITHSINHRFSHHQCTVHSVGIKTDKFQHIRRRMFKWAILKYRVGNMIVAYYK